MTLYISIGSSCTAATLFQRLKVKKETLPFDWMFSTPEFVYTIFSLLFIEQKEINDIVDNYFFVCDKKASIHGLEHHIINEEGSVLVNSRYSVCFPHVSISDRDKYIRRMQRLKEFIYNKDKFIYFVYVSPSSQTKGNYTLDGAEPIQDVYEYIEKMNIILKTIRSNYKILVFDTNKPSHIIQSDVSNIAYYDIKKQDNWMRLLPELIEKSNKIMINS
jgi:hypothetical protein